MRGARITNIKMHPEEKVLLQFSLTENTGGFMKRMLFAILASLSFYVSSASAACLTTTTSYPSGSIPAYQKVVAWGPTTIVLSSPLGSPCTSATLSFKVSVATGSKPSLAVDRKVGASWNTVATGSSSAGAVTAYGQPAGEYRLRLVNGTAASISYTGTATISR